MTPERWHQVKQIFTEACALEGGARERYLSQACAADPALRAQVESLLTAHAAPGAMDHPPSRYLPDSEPEPDPAPDAWLGKSLGAYQLVACIGRGGMGVVYRARRADAQFDREVAIKVVRAGLGSELILKRFSAERQILAALDHPNIARLLDAGVTARGEPFLVLELVDGQPIDEYCDRHQLSIEACLRLFREVCAAVSYAHRHLVVHRDLKPANILVTAEGSVRLLDFGIAKLLQAEHGGVAAEATRTVLRALTPEFSSPEQLLGLPISTASDVYSLGVVLFHLLAGRSPYRSNLESTQEAIRDVCESEPLRPSSAAAQAGQRGNRAPPDRELDDIVLRALRKEPDKRYGSVEEFSEDVRRYLAGLPVIARGDRLSYRAGKFWRRHRLALTAAALMGIALLAGLVTAVREARIAEQQRALAARHFASVRKLANTFIFQVHDAIKDLPGATPARDLVVSTALGYLDTLARQAGADRGLQKELADSYARLGDIQGMRAGPNTGHDKAALESYTKAIALYERLAGAGPTDTAVLSGMAAAHVSRSELLMMVNGDPRAAARESRRGSELYSQLAASRPVDPKVQEALADAYGLHAYQEFFAGEDAAALEASAHALATMEALARQHPADGQIELALYQAYSYHLLLLPHGVAAAEVTGPGLQMAHKVLAYEQQRFDAATLHDAAAWRAMAVDWNHVGLWSAIGGDNGAALEAFRAATDSMEKATAADSHNAQGQLDLGRVSLNRARIELALGQLDAAENTVTKDKALFDSILHRTDTYEVRYFVAECEEELGSIELQRALASSSPREQLRAWQSAHDWFARAVPHFAPITKVAALSVWDRPPVDRAEAGLSRSTAEIGRLQDTLARR